MGAYIESNNIQILALNSNPKYYYFKFVSILEVRVTFQLTWNILNELQDLLVVMAFIVFFWISELEKSSYNDCWIGLNSQ